MIPRNLTPTESQSPLLVLLWRQFYSPAGLVWVWLAGLTTITALGLNMVVIRQSDRQIILLALISFAVAGRLFKWYLLNWSSWVVAWGLGIGYLLLVWAGLLLPIWRVVNGLLKVGGLWLQQADPQPAINLLQQDWLAGHYAALLVISRLTGLITQHGSAGDTYLASTWLWGLALWLAVMVLHGASWRHYQAIAAIIPAGTLLSLAVFFSGKGYGYLILFITFTILLQASLQGLRRETGWIAQRIDYATDLFSDLNIMILIVCVMIITVTYAAPTVPLWKFARTMYEWVNFNPQQVNNLAAFWGLDTTGNSPEAGRSAGLPRRHLLGNPPDLSRQLVMTVKTGEFSAMPPDLVVQFDIPRYYWYGLSYTGYTSAGWKFEADPAITIDASAQLTHATAATIGRILTQSVQRGAYAGDLLYAAGSPLKVSLPAQASYDFVGDLVAAVLPADPRLYIVQSWLVDTSPSRLRSAGTNYPQSIISTYLSLPDSVPIRIKKLAQQLTVQQPTPFDKALALETYLRSFPYTLNVPPPLAGKDVADYFLFDLQKGYCDYYATAMVVMARSIGLPARFVAGYAPGSYDPLQAAYRVVEADAHSWVQIYFPGTGWVNFEPTAGQAAIIRKETGISAAPQPAAVTPSPPNTGPQPPAWMTPLGIHLFWWMMAALIIGYLMLQFDGWRIGRLPPKTAAGVLYQRLVHIAQQTGYLTDPGCTPYEFSAQFTGYLQQQLAQSKLPVPDLNRFTGLHQFADEFVNQQYAPPGKSGNSARRLFQLWQSLYPWLWWAIVVIRLSGKLKPRIITVPLHQ